VRVAGVQVGKITKVKLENGIAIVTMELDQKWKKKLDMRDEDTTALLRPRTGLKDMFIELDPGGTGDPLEQNDTIPVENTAPDVDPDEVLAALDTDTRSYLQLLISGAGKGLKGRGHDLNRTFKALAPLNRDVARVTSAIAERREDLKKLVHNYGQLTNTLADADGSIRRLINSSEATFRAFASEEANIRLAVSKLPGTLRQTEETLADVDTFSRVAGPTLESLRPAFRQLDEANRAVRPFVLEAEPIVRTRIRPFVRTARPAIRDLRPAAINLARATPDLEASFYQLNRFFNMAGHNPKGREPVTGTAADRQRDEGYLFWLGWVAQNTTSLFSTSDAQGPLRRFVLLFNCTTLRGFLGHNPAAGPLLGFTNALNDPGLCPTAEGAQGSDSPLPGLPLPGTSKEKGKANNATPAAPGAAPSPSTGKPTEGAPPAAPPAPATPKAPDAPGTPAVPEGVTP
jgi:phospholipid/cholesterol/gamma-HCH transport system substrate-binding protein